jgi:hypothetical protein
LGERIPIIDSFGFRFDPIFTQIYTESNEVKIISLWEAIRLVGKIPEPKPFSNDDQVYTVQELSSKAKKGGWGPVVVFAEVKKKMSNLRDEQKIDSLSIGCFHQWTGIIEICSSFQGLQGGSKGWTIPSHVLQVSIKLLSIQ